MFKPVLAFFSALLLTAASNAQTNLITICSGSTPVIDGIHSPGEWDDAAVAKINLTADTVYVHYKHDGDSLYLLYYGPLESSNVLFPEVLLDVNNDKANTWSSNDWWFHVSATDCNFNGQYGNYNGNCLADHPGWSALPNFVNGPPATDTVEMVIPFSTPGISIGDTLGITFDVTNTATVWKHWPTGATRNNPATWGTAVIGNCTIGMADPGVNGLPVITDWFVSPNPAVTAITVSRNPGSVAEFVLYSIDGREIKRFAIAAGDHKTTIDLSEIVTGIYFLQMTDLHGKQLKRIIKI